MTPPHIPLHDLTPAPQQLHIASLVAHVRPEQLSAVCDWILQSSHHNIRSEIHAENSQGKLVIVTESPAEKAIANFLDELREQAGVLNAALVYHEYLSAEDLRDDSQHEVHV